MPQKLYLDSSALVKLVVDEAESEALRNRLELDVVPTSSVVSAVEVPRAARRRGVAFGSELFETIVTLDLTEDVITRAAEVEPTSLSSFDAVHLASALLLRSELESFVAYDARLLEAARANGLEVASPA
jgi:uncharacterized protein